MLTNETSITREFEFASGHRINGHEGKCAACHGHGYRALVTVIPTNNLDSLGRVIDFSVVKEKVGTWIDTNWDHTFILGPDDNKLAEAISLYCKGGKPYICYAAPTAENLAETLFLAATDLFEGFPIKVIEVVLYETPKCFATVSVLTHKPCKVCGRLKPLEKFRLYYKTCTACQGRLYRQSVKGKVSTLKASARYKAKTIYRDSLETIENFRTVQKNRCAICGEVPSKPLQADHDHKLGGVRGLLCRSCNLLLGHCNEDPTIILKAIEYLSMYRSSIPPET